MSLIGPSASNGRNNHKTQVSKFLYGGRFDNLLKGHDKIVNGMEDPSFFAFTFGIDMGLTGLFGLPGNRTNTIYDLNTDRNYSVLTYLENAISPNTQAMIESGKLIETENNKFADLNKLFKKDEYGNIVAPDTSNGNVSLTFSNELDNMRKFVNGFRYVTINHPYMFQQVDGLQDAYKKYYNLHKDSYLGGNDSKLKFKCLESMDLRMSALFDSYFKAVYNHKYRRMNIPRNLLRFDCWVLVHDLRNIRMDGTSLLNAISNAEVTEDIVYNLSTILFVFKNCTFDIEEIGSMVGNVTNTEANQTAFEFGINYTDLDVHVNALADVIESGGDANISNIYREKYDLLDIYSLNDELTSLNLGSLVTNIGSTIFNYATMGSSMGNVYDRSWAGILSSLYSSISGAGVAGVLNSAIGQGIGMTKDKIFEKKQEEITYTNTTTRGESPYGQTTGFVGENVYDENDSSHEQLVEDNIYEGTVPEPEPLVQDNLYNNFPSQHEPLVQDNLYDNFPSQHEPFVQEDVDMSTNGMHEQLTQSEVDMSTNGTHEQLVATNIYPSSIPHESYVQETIDMSTNAQHKNIESVKLYPDEVEHDYIDDLGSVYSFTQTETGMIPINVYERIIESRNNANITIDKIFIPPTKAPSLEIEYVEEPIKETKASSSEELNANANETKQKIKRQIYSIGNVYSN